MIVKIPKELTGKKFSFLINTDYIMDVHYHYHNKALRINYPRGDYMIVSQVGTEEALEPLLDKILEVLKGTSL